MEKILVKKIFRCQFYLALAAMAIFGAALWQMGKEHVYHEMRQVLDHEEAYYSNTQGILDEKVSHYVSDYMTKLHGVDYMLGEHEDLRNNDCLQSLSTFLGVKTIYLFDDDGSVLLSSDENAVGARLLDVEDAAPFAQMIEHGGDVIFNFECGAIIAGGDGLNFMAAPATIEGYSMVLVGIDKRIAEELQDEVAMQGLMLQIPTTHDNALFAIEMSTGKLLGKTVGNDLLDAAVNYDYDWAELTETFRHSDKGKIIRVEGVPTFLMTRVVDDVIFVDVRLAASQLKQILWIFLGLLIMNIAIASFAVLVVKRYFHKYVFGEIDAIQQTITRLINGDESAEFHTDGGTELSDIAVTLNAWNKSIHHTQKKLNWVINATNPNAAMFECLSYMNSVYYSDNLQSVLGLEQAQWDAIKDDVEKFRAYFSALDQRKDEHGIVALEDKFLRLRLYQMDEDYFGILVDKTDSVKERNQQATDLRRAIDDSEADSLTGLLNRRGFEVHTGRALASGAASVVMLMMDVDNFKQVNDMLGHPEGDVLLKKIGACLKRQFRESDLVARLGGDEFTVFLTGMTDQFLRDKLDGLMEALRGTLAEYAQCGTSVSIGAARIDGGQADYSTLYERADKALYAAKRSGKNRYEFFSQ